MVLPNYSHTLTLAHRALCLPQPFLSREAKDIVKKLLTTEPTRRGTLDQIAAHPWCLAAADAVVRPGGAAGGAVAQLTAEAQPDATTIKEMEAAYGYSAMAVAKELAEGKHSEASGTYHLLRLRTLRQSSEARRTGSVAPAAPAAPSGSQSARTHANRANTGLAEKLAERGGHGGAHSARDGRKSTNYSHVPVPQTGKENLYGPSITSPAPKAATANANMDTPSKKLTRSPKPLTLLPAAEEQARGEGETRRSSPGLFKAPANHHQPVGAAHAVARANRTDNNVTLAAFRERMRGEGMAGGVTRTEAPAPSPRGRPNSARTRAQRAAGGNWGGTTTRGMVPVPPAAAMHPHRKPSRPGSPRDSFRNPMPAPREQHPAAAVVGMAPPAGSSRRGADFRSRKYGSQPGHARAIISAR